MVETERPPDSVRAMEFPAPVETTVQEARDCGHCCMDTVTVLAGILAQAKITERLRKRIEGLIEGQREMGKRFENALWKASREMKAREEAMHELPVLKVPLTSSRDRPSATGRFAICETPGCGNPLREAQAIVSLKRHGNRLCLNCEQQRAVDAIARHEVELPLEGGEMSETPQAFR